ncbi:hypothetical protein [Actinoallomurus sp. CA-142502]
MRTLDVRPRADDDIPTAKRHHVRRRGAQRRASDGTVPATTMADSRA